MTVKYKGGVRRSGTTVSKKGLTPVTFRNEEGAKRAARFASACVDLDRSNRPDNSIELADLRARIEAAISELQ